MRAQGKLFLYRRTFFRTKHSDEFTSEIIFFPWACRKTTQKKEKRYKTQQIGFDVSFLRSNSTFKQIVSRQCGNYLIPIQAIYFLTKTQPKIPSYVTSAFFSFCSYPMTVQ